MTKHVTTLMERAWMAVMKDSKESYAKQHVVLGNMDRAVSSDAVIIVTTTKFVTPSLEIAANARMVSRMRNVMNNVMVDIMERVVCFNVDTVWMISPVTALMVPVPEDVCQDGRLQISVINHAEMVLLE